MPQGVKIGTTIVLAILALILIWSVYHNVYRVAGGWATALEAEVVGAGREAETLYRLEVISHTGEASEYTLSSGDAYGLQPGDRVHIRPGRDGDGRVVRSRRLNLAEMVALATEIHRIRVTNVQVQNGEPVQAEAEILQTLKGPHRDDETTNGVAGENPSEGFGQTQATSSQRTLTFSLVVQWIEQGDASMYLDVKPQEELLLFLDNRGRVLAGPSGVIQLSRPSGEVEDIELSLRLPVQTLLEDVERMVQGLERSVDISGRSTSSS